MYGALSAVLVEICDEFVSSVNDGGCMLPHLFCLKYSSQTNQGKALKVG